MNALLISDNFPPRKGGSGRWFWEIYSRIPRSDCIIAAGEAADQAEFDRTHDLRIVRLPITLTAWGLRSWRGLTGYGDAFRRLRHVVKKHRPDRVHAARVLPEGVMAWCLKRWFGLPYLCYVHGEEITCTSESRELRWLARQVVAGADFLIANSQNTAAIVQQAWYAAPDRVRLLYPGVDTTRFCPAPRDPALRRDLGWGDRPVVLTVGRLQKRKGHDNLIRALRQIQCSIPSVLYAIVGDGEERSALMELAEREGVTAHVQFLGELSDERLISCYQQCDLFVLPNRQVGQDIEGFGMVLLEAQACGKSVIAGASGGTAETMKIPATGQVVDCSTPDELGRLIAEWLTEPARLADTGAAARQWVVERFDWKALVAQAEDLFRQHRPGRRKALKEAVLR